MNRHLECRRDDRGFTALETAIILMAFVVVASVFAFTMLSSGMSSTEQSKQAIAAGMEEVSGSMELRGSVIAAGSEDAVTSVTFCVANAAGGDPIDLTTGENNVLVIDYRTTATRTADVAWTVAWQGNNDGDSLLEDRELAEITVAVPAGSTLSANTEFVLEVRPEKGGVLEIERTTPAKIDAVMDLG